ncbi:MAG: AAA family ATPase [Deltaproteobacteria bacterium]|nr:AAA family ATPase [Deltaproteobacteria bacterium]
MVRDVNDAGPHNGYAEPMDPPDEKGGSGDDKGAGGPRDPSSQRIEQLFNDQWKWISERTQSDGKNWFQCEPPNRKYLITDRDGKGVLPAGKVGMIAGGGGTGKSLLLVQAAICVAAQHELLGTFSVPISGPVLLAAGEEDEDEIWRRLFGAARAMNLSPAEKEMVAKNILPMPLCGKRVALTYSLEELRQIGGDLESLMDRGTPFAVELLRRLSGAGREWALIILDPASRFAGPDVEIDNAAATRFIQALERFTEVPGNPTLLFSHHTTKASRTGASDAVSARGASGLTDGVRWQANLDPVMDANDKRKTIPCLAKFRVTKSNYALYPPEVLLVRDSRHQGFLRPATDAEKLDHQNAVDAAKNASGKKKSRPTVSDEDDGADYSQEELVTF